MEMIKIRRLPWGAGGWGAGWHRRFQQQYFNSSNSMEALQSQHFNRSRLSPAGPVAL